MKNTIQINRTDNMTVRKKDAIIMDKNTINLAGEVTSSERRYKRYQGTQDYKIKQFMHKFMIVVLTIFMGILIFNQLNAEETTFVGELERVVELNDEGKATEQDIDNLVEILDKEYNEEITEENIEGSDKSYEEFMKKGEELHKLKYEEQKKNEIIEQAFNFIIQFEGYHDKPYADYNQVSCGFGMKCSWDTKNITWEKSKQFVIERIENIRKKYNLYEYDDNVEIALISFAYNIGSIPKGTSRYIDNGYKKAFCNDIKQYVYAGGKKLRGLEKRRNTECDLILK